MVTKPFSDETRRATDTRIDLKRGGGAILCAGAALHAGIEMDEFGFILMEGKHLVWTDLQTPTAADTFFGMYFQSRHIA